MYRNIIILTTILLLTLFDLNCWAANKLPDSVFQHYNIVEESSPEVHALVMEASDYVYPDPEKARSLFCDAYKLLGKGADIDEYDYLWTQYGLLKSSFESGTASFLSGTGPAEYIKVAQNVLAYLDKQDVGQWAFTELGAFRMEVYREAGNGLAWLLQSDPNVDKRMLEQALKWISKTEAYIRDSQDYYIYDTKVRILLKLKREQEAFEIVHEILAEDPDFGDFQDLKASKKYQAWEKIRKTTKTSL